MGGAERNEEEKHFVGANLDFLYKGCGHIALITFSQKKTEPKKKRIKQITSPPQNSLCDPSLIIHEVPDVIITYPDC